MSDELRKRIITAFFGVSAILLLVTVGGHIGAAFFAAVMALGMVFEFSTISFTLSDRFEKRNLLLGITWLVAFINFWMPRTEYELLLISFLCLFCYFLFTAERHPGQAFSEHFRELMFSVFGILYLAFLPLYLPLIRDSGAGLHWTLLFLFIVWATDIGAYFAGMKFGTRKLYSMISPKKTVEGAIGGTLSGIFVALLYKLVFFHAMNWSTVVLLPVILAVVSQVGDLCESFLKRASHVKDSGNILPGHGGFLDRFDGVVFSLPVMYGCIRLFG